jgi:hypothetical protein
MRFVFLAFFCLLLAHGCGSSGGGGLTPVDIRSFAMGFTPFPYAVSQAAVDDVYAKLGTDADIVAHHFDDGIPWNDALVDTYPYDNHIMNDWAQRLAKTAAGHMKYVAVTPISLDRNALAPLRDTADNMAWVAPFDVHGANGDFNHADVKTALLNYCKRVIAYFSPDYLAIGIEVNLLRTNTDQATWMKDRELNQFVYTELNKLYPSLPIFASVSPAEMVFGYPAGLPAEFTGNPVGYRDSQIAVLSDVLAFSDYYALSIYSFLTAFHDSSLPTDFLDTLFSLGSKPITIAETGMLAETQTAFGLVLAGSPTMQKSYVESLLSVSDAHDVAFVNWFVLQDYDQLCIDIGGCTEFESLWRDSGLYDGAGIPRSAHGVWRDYLSKPM